MLSRLALGSSTKAKARFDALLRVIARLCSMSSGKRVRRAFDAHGRQSPGLGQRRVARPMFAPAPTFAVVPALPADARAGIHRSFRGFLRLVRMMVVVMMRMAMRLFAEVNGPDQHQRGDHTHSAEDD